MIRSFVLALAAATVAFPAVAASELPAGLRLAQAYLSASAQASTEAQACRAAQREAEIACNRVGRDGFLNVPCSCTASGGVWTCSATTECIPRW